VQVVVRPNLRSHGVQNCRLEIHARSVDDATFRQEHEDATGDRMNAKPVATTVSSLGIQALVCCVWYRACWLGTALTDGTNNRATMCFVFPGLTPLTALVSHVQHSLLGPEGSVPEL